MGLNNIQICFMSTNYIVLRVLISVICCFSTLCKIGKQTNQTNHCVCLQDKICVRGLHIRHISVQIN